MAEDKEVRNQNSNSTKGQGTILIVDDDRSIRKVVKEFLRSRGFETEVAVAAQPAVEILNRTKVNLVITNIRMPGMDGLELTRLIRDGYDSEVIIMTGYHSYTHEEAARVGACDLIHKPAKLKNLLDSINRVLNK